QFTSINHSFIASFINSLTRIDYCPISWPSAFGSSVLTRTTANIVSMHGHRRARERSSRAVVVSHVLQSIPEPITIVGINSSRIIISSRQKRRSIRRNRLRNGRLEERKVKSN
ncbi:hypothetical protein PENTCL1PPCAC_2753, partial [Pristionchus entomophagus]